jgi:hypothetical protein
MAIACGGCETCLRIIVVALRVVRGEHALRLTSTPRDVVLSLCWTAPCVAPKEHLLLAYKLSHPESYLISRSQPLQSTP